METPSFDLYLDLRGPVQLEYLPTRKSRKWRKGPIRLKYTELAYQDAITLAKQENWHAWRYVSFT